MQQVRSPFTFKVLYGTNSIRLSFIVRLADTDTLEAHGGLRDYGVDQTWAPQGIFSCQGIFGSQF
jgi:hypothetical protein